MKQYFPLLLILTLFLILSSVSCKKDPYVPDFNHAGGYVIGKETCKADTSMDYWLVDLSYEKNPPSESYGDTITINGNFYKHMVKTTQLLSQFKIIGQKVSFDFYLSSDKVQSTGCTVQNPVVYYLKDMNVLESGEIR